MRIMFTFTYWFQSDLMIFGFISVGSSDINTIPIWENMNEMERYSGIRISNGGNWRLMNLLPWARSILFYFFFNC